MRQITPLAFTVLALVASASSAFASNITLPTVTPSDVVDYYVPISSVVPYASDAAQTYTAGTYIGSYVPGDVVTLTFAAPAGQRFVYDVPSESKDAYFYAAAEFGPTPDALPQEFGDLTSISFQGLTGTAPTMSGSSVLEGGGNSVLGVSASGSVSANFSFTSVQVTFTVPNGYSQPDTESLSLSSEEFRGFVDLPQSSTDPGPFFTLQPSPEPATFSIALIALPALLIRRRRASNPCEYA